MNSKLLLLALFLRSSLAWSAASVEYRLSFPNVLHHEAEVQVLFSGVSQASLEVLMSRSSPGRYALHEFAKNVYNLSAKTPKGAPLNVVRSSPSSWTISGHSGAVLVTYTLFADHADGTYAGIDATHAHLNPPAALVWAHGFESAPVRLRFDPPPSSGWRIATQLLQLDDGSLSAPDMAALMDSPIELSAHTLYQWQAGGQTFRVALHHRGSAALAARFAELCQRVSLESAGVFGAFPKFDNGAYTFLVDNLPYVFRDGMEHRNSTSISDANEVEDPSHAVATASHEFFHAWNVKRIRPLTLQPFDFERANMSGELWFAEGFTSYYGPLAIRRSGISNTAEFLQEMSHILNEVLTAPGREIGSAVDMSNMAPFVDAARSIDVDNFANTFISYYDYGAALAFGLDLSIRQKFPGKSLDDWMRTVWRRHPDIDRPYTLADLEQELAEATGDRAFAHEVFARHIYGKEPLEYAKLLPAAGLLLRRTGVGAPWLGVGSLSDASAGVKVGGPVLRGSPAYSVGLERGDVLRRFDGKSLKKVEDLSKLLAKRHVGDEVAIEAQTRSGVRNFVLRIAEEPGVEIVTFEEAGKPIDSAIQSFRADWFGSKALKVPLSQPSMFY